MHAVLNGRHLLGHAQSSDPRLQVLVELLCKLQAGGCDQLVSQLQEVSELKKSKIGHASYHIRLCEVQDHPK